MSVLPLGALLLRDEELDGTERLLQRLLREVDRRVVAVARVGRRLLLQFLQQVSPRSSDPDGRALGGGGSPEGWVGGGSVRVGGWVGVQ